MNALVTLILIGALGFLLGQFLFLRPRPGSWLERFFLSGAEFVLLGALIGPRGFRLLDPTELVHLEPFLILALSWVGLLVGLQLRWGVLVRFPRAYFSFAILEAVVALLAVGAALVLLFLWWVPTPDALDHHRWRAAFCLATVAALSSPTELAAHPGIRVRAGHAAGLLRFVPAVAPVVGLAGVAVLFSIWHVSDGLPGAEAAWVWLLASVGGGLVLGVLFHLLLRTTNERDEIVVVVLGMALFAGGAASVFRLSPLVVCLVVGAVLGNLRSASQEALLHMFMRFERPLYVALLVLAGAAWAWDNLWGYALAALYLLLRAVGKAAGVRMAALVTPLPFRPGSRWWLGLMPQGAMAVAIAVSYRMAYYDPMVEIVFSAILVSTLVLGLFPGMYMRAALGEDRS